MTRKIDKRKSRWKKAKTINVKKAFSEKSFLDLYNEISKEDWEKEIRRIEQQNEMLRRAGLL